jgi:CBS domain-containing protein
MMGGALGALEATVLPSEGPGMWPLVSMVAMLGGTMRSPFTAIIFGFELTHNVHALLPMMVAVVVAHGFTVLVLRRSILTEKVSRRGFHLTRDYGVDPLEVHVVREAMQTAAQALEVDADVAAIARQLTESRRFRRQRLYPVIDANRRLIGVLTRAEIRGAAPPDGQGAPVSLDKIATLEAVVAHPDETLRTAVYRMAATGKTRLPVTDRRTGAFLGLLSLNDLLKARARHLKEESQQERVIVPKLRAWWVGGSRQAAIGEG